MKLAATLLLATTILATASVAPAAPKSPKSTVKSAQPAPAVKRQTIRDGYSIVIPHGWDFKVDPDFGTALFHSGGGGYIGLAVTSITPENVKDLLAGIGALNAEAMSADPGLKLKTVKQIVVAGRPAVESIGTHTSIENGYVSQDHQILIHKRGGDWYHVEFVGENKYLPDVAALLNSILWTNPNEEALPPSTANDQSEAHQ